MTGQTLKAKLTSFYGQDDFLERAAKELDVDKSTIYRYLSAERVPGPVAAWCREKSRNAASK